MPGMTVSQIKSQAEKASNALSALELEIRDDINAVYDKSDSEARPPNGTEKAKVKQLRASLGDIYAAKKTLALITAALLDKSEDVKELKKQFDRINGQIQDDLNELKKAVDTAEQAAAAAKYVAQVTSGLAELAIALRPGP